MQYDVVLRVRTPLVMRQSGIATPWQAGIEALPSSGCVVPSFREADPRIASTAITGSWAVEMGHLDMGCLTTSGEGRGVAQDTETRCRHPSCLTVVLLHDWVWGCAMAFSLPFIVAFAWIRALIELPL